MNAPWKPAAALGQAAQYPVSDAHLALLVVTEARKRSLQRMLQALFREGLLPKEHLVTEGAISWLPLWTQQGMLRFEGLQFGRCGNCQLSGSVAYYRHGEPPRPLSQASALLMCVAPSLPGQAAGDDLQRLVAELDNSFDNDVLCLAYHRQWGPVLAGALGPLHEHFIAALRASDHPNPALLLEQWGTLGHPWHPTFKTKLGLSAEDVMALSPEFQPTLRVPVAAIRAAKAHIAFAGDEGEDDTADAYRQWFARSFPACWRSLQDALRAQNRTEGDWLPLPLHPYQAQRKIPHAFADDIARGDLLLTDVCLDATPTMSFRTVVPDGSPTLPHLKLPVSLRLTSVQRTVSPKSTVMGPRLTRLLGAILKHEQGFGHSLDIVREDVGLHYLDAQGDDDRARHLSILYRANPMAKRSPALFPIPVGSLFAGSPFSGRPLATELVSLACGDHAEGAVGYFQSHAHTVLTATLSAYLLYGIAFEAHQQNSFIMVDRQYKPAQLLVRDFGDLRIHGPSLRRAGLGLDVYRPGHTVYEDDALVRDKLLHAVMLCHLSELALLLSRAYVEAEGSFFNVLRHEVETVFANLRPRTCPTRWRTERQALLDHDWPAKSFLRMRLQDTQDDVHGSMPNPLRPASSR